MKKHLQGFFVLLLILLLTLAGCQNNNETKETKNNSQTQSETTAETEDAEAASSSKIDTSDPEVVAEFNQYLYDSFVESVSSDDLNLHFSLRDPSSYGIETTAVSMGRLDPQTLEKNAENNIQALKELKGFDREKLDAKQQFTYDLLYDYISMAVQGDKYTYYQEIMNSTTGIQAQLPVLMAEYVFYSKEDIDTYISLLEDIYPYYESMIAFEKEKSARGLFMSDTNADSVIKGCQDYIAEPDNNVLLTTFESRLNNVDGLTEEEKADYTARNAAAVKDYVIPAYEMLITEIGQLKGTGKAESGLCNMEGGKEAFKFMIKDITGSGRTPEEMIELLDEYLMEDLNIIALIYSKNPEILESVDDVTYPSQDPQETLEFHKEAMKKDFPELPDVSYEVKYVDPSLEDSLSPAFYLIAPVDDINNNVIYINGGSSSGSDIFITLAHEGYPGHLYQTAYFYNTKPYEIRSCLNYTGYAEGWATYVENLSYSWSMDDDTDMADLLAANNEASLILYSRIDIGANYEGWTVDEVCEYLKSYWGEDAAQYGEEIYNAVTFDPGNYSAYCIGNLEFKELRRKAEQALDDKFDAKAFHQFILETGSCPFYLLEDRLDEWLKEQQ